MGLVVERTVRRQGLVAVQGPSLGQGGLRGRTGHLRPRFKVGSNGPLVGVTDNGNGHNVLLGGALPDCSTYLDLGGAHVLRGVHQLVPLRTADSMHVLNYVLPEQHLRVRSRRFPDRRHAQHLLEALSACIPFVK